MKINIYTRTGRDELQRQRMEIDGKVRKHVHPLSECPEDAIIERDLTSCDEIAAFMVEAHAAGARGEAMEVHELPESGD